MYRFLLRLLTFVSYSSCPGLMYLHAECEIHLKLTSIVFIDVQNHLLDRLWRINVFVPPQWKCFRETWLFSAFCSTVTLFIFSRE